MITIAVAAVATVCDSQADFLARKLDLALLPTGVNPETIDQPEAVLFAAEHGLFLQQTGRGAPGPVSVCFGSAAMRHRRRCGQNELLGRSVGAGKKSPLRVLDATAGLGRDSFVLADLGVCVYLCERHPLIVELLASGLAQAGASGDEWLRQVRARMELLPGDARSLAASQLQLVDVIYLDPMFPARNKSASVKKEMALLQWVLGPQEYGADADALLLWALSQDVRRVVVKRPVKAPVLAGRKPAHVIAGKAVRYDVYVLGPIV